MKYKNPNTLVIGMCQSFESSALYGKIEGVDIHYTGSYLHRAVYMNSYEAFNVLIEQGVDICVKDSNNQTPLDLAYALDRKEMCALLNQRYYDMRLQTLSRWGRACVNKVTWQGAALTGLGSIMCYAVSAVFGDCMTQQIESNVLIRLG